MIFQTFAKRKALQLSKGEPDVYIYDKASTHFRYQICLAIIEGMGNFSVYNGSGMGNVPCANNAWDIVDTVCRKEIESYMVAASKKFQDNIAQRFLDYVSTTVDIDDLLSAVEVVCIILDGIKDDDYGNSVRSRNAKVKASDALEEINGRFEQNSIGYRFENGNIIRIDSKLIHSEIVKPALLLLTAPIFSKANEDFMTAHRHYRSGEYKDAVTSANRSFESTLKAICDNENWIYNKGDRASELITKVRSNGLFSHDFDKSFDGYVAMLKSGLPALRNDVGAHGESLASPAVTLQIARFAINMTATNILFVADSYMQLKRLKR